MVNVWERYPAIEEYVLTERIGSIARQLTRSSVMSASGMTMP